MPRSSTSEIWGCPPMCLFAPLSDGYSNSNALKCKVLLWPCSCCSCSAALGGVTVARGLRPMMGKSPCCTKAEEAPARAAAEHLRVNTDGRLRADSERAWREAAASTRDLLRRRVSWGAVNEGEAEDVIFLLASWAHPLSLYQVLPITE